MSQSYGNISKVNKDIDKLLENILSTTGKWYENLVKITPVSVRSWLKEVKKK